MWMLRAIMWMLRAIMWMLRAKSAREKLYGLTKELRRRTCLHTRAAARSLASFGRVFSGLAVLAVVSLAGMLISSSSVSCAHHPKRHSLRQCRVHPLRGLVAAIVLGGRSGASTRWARELSY
eukprot:1178438-Prorocentrum_minimum.AAC.4